MRFSFTLLDKVSGPADTIAKNVKAAGEALRAAKPALDAVNVAELRASVAAAKNATEIHRLNVELGGYVKQLAPAEQKTKALTVEMGNAFHSIAGFRRSTEGNWTLNLAEGFSSVVSVVERLGSALYDVTAKAVGVGAAAEKTGRAFRLNLGDPAAKRLQGYVGGVSEASRGLYTKAQLNEQIAPLVRQGIGAGDINKWLAASHSIETRGGSATDALGALAGVKTHRTIDTGTLAALGFGSFADQQRVAGRLGFKGLAQRNPEMALSNVSQQLQINPRKADRVVAVLLDELAKREGGKLGAEAAGARTDPAATLQRLANLPQLLSEKLAASGAITPLYQALDRFADTVTGPAGQGFVNALSAVVEAVAGLVELTSRLFKSEAEKVRDNHGIAFTDKRGNITESLSSEQVSKLAQRQLAAQGKTSNNINGLPFAEREQLALKQLRDDKKAEGKGTVLLPAGGDAIQFGYNLELGRQQADLVAKSGPLQIPQAGDMVWRGDSAVQIDPHDTVMAFKRGGSLGIGDGGGSGGGMQLMIAPGAIVVQGAGKSGAEIADEVLDKICAAPATLMMSAMEQFAVDIGAQG